MQGDPLTSPGPSQVRERVLAGLRALCRVVVGKDAAVRRAVAVLL